MRAAESVPAGSELRGVGVVAIGRNEGDRLRRCFDSLPEGLSAAVYVDSSSTDGSVAEARRRGIDVVALDLSTPFTAARARNEGLRLLRERSPDVRYVQLVDGDCALAPGWVEAALRALEADPRLAIVCGRRREAHPDASVYNRLCDMEWNTPVGDAESCGGDALARMDALLEVGGYDERLIAGEEPDLCARLRDRGWRIRRIDHDMTIHDAAMTRFVQWWRRSLRTGHGFAQVAATRPPLYRRELRSCVLWGGLVPLAAVSSAPWTGGGGLVLLLAYPALWSRVFAWRRRRKDPPRDAAVYATFCLLGKIPELAGAARYWWNESRGRPSRIVEYK